jgi:hypothetical protein
MKEIEARPGHWNVRPRTLGSTVSSGWEASPNRRPSTLGVGPGQWWSDPKSPVAEPGKGGKLLVISGECSFAEGLQTSFGEGLPTPAFYRLRSARDSRPRRSTDRRSPGDAPTIGDGGRRGRAGQETVPEPAWRRQPQATAMGQSDPLPRTPHGQGSVCRQRFGVNPPGLGRVGDECSFLAWSLRHQAPTCRPIRVLVARARSESSMGPGR